MKKVKLFVLVAVIIVLGVGIASAINFYSPPYGPSFVAWDIDGHEVSPVATVPGETLWMEIDVEAPFDIKEFTVHAYFVINGVSIECQLSENDYALSLMLPIVEHANFTCFIEFPIYEFLPPIPMELLLVFEGQNGAVIAGGSIDLDVYEGI